MVARSRSPIGLANVWRKSAAFVLALLLLLIPRAVAAQEELVRARQLYNSGRFAEAMAAAEAARSRPKVAASATLVIARCRLERFRASGDQQDLATAREELIALDPMTLSEEESVEWNLGVAEALVLENQLGPASEIFAALIPHSRTRLAPGEMEKLIEWWASAVVRVAETLAGSARAGRYSEMLSRLKSLTDDKLPSRGAVYWSVIALRGMGDLDAAWDAAAAGWVRARAIPGGDQLRKDLDKFVTDTLIPERAQARTGERLDQRATMAEIFALTEEWRGLTQRWAETN